MSTAYVGEVRMFAGGFVPAGWLECDGGPVAANHYPALTAAIGTAFGGDGATTLGLPDLRGRTPLGAGNGPGLTPRPRGEAGGTETVTLTTAQLPEHRHSVHAAAALADSAAPAGRTWAVPVDSAPYRPGGGDVAMAAQILRSAGGGEPHENRSPVVGVRFGICHQDQGAELEDPMLGEIRLFATAAVPERWAPCDGRTLPIEGNGALYTLLTTTYGGNGITDFALPDLRGRVPVHRDASRQALGQRGGAETVTLTVAAMPEHTHGAVASSAAATSPSPAGATWAVTERPRYRAGGQVVATSTGAAGATQPHPNMPPYLALTFAIAVVGVFPTRN